MEKKFFISPQVDIVVLGNNDIICSSGPEPVDHIIKDNGSFGFDPSEKI